VQQAVIVDAVRTPMGRGKPGGALSAIHPAQLLATVLKALVEPNGLDPAEVDDVIIGCVSQVGEQSLNVARGAVMASRATASAHPRVLFLGSYPPPECGIESAITHRGRHGHAVEQHVAGVTRFDSTTLTKNRTDGVQVSLPQPCRPLAVDRLYRTEDDRRTGRGMAFEQREKPSVRRDLIVVDKGHERRGRRIECRIPGADANPYIAFAATIAAGLYGIENKLELPPELKGNAYESDVQRFPHSMRTAIDALEQGKMARHAFGDDVIDHYLNYAQTEQALFDKVVTDYERARLFERG